MKTKTRFTADDLPASRAVLDPYAKLAAAIVVQAIDDIKKKPNRLERWGAAAWLVTDGELFLDELGFTVQEDDLILEVTKWLNIRCGTRRPGRPGLNPIK